VSVAFRDCAAVAEYLGVETRRAFHDMRKPQVDDRHRSALIKAERELHAIEIILDHVELSEIAQTRLADALNAIYRALELKRPALGLYARDQSKC
jgi:hypothetical protein